MLTTPLNRSSIDKGKAILDKIESKIKQATKYQNKFNFDDYKLCMDQIFKLNNEYLSVLPQIHYEKINVIQENYQLVEERGSLDKILLLSNSILRALAAYHRQDKINPIDYALSTISIPIEILDKAAPEYFYIMQMLNNSITEKIYINDIFQIEDQHFDKSMSKEFENYDNHIMLPLTCCLEDLMKIIYEDCKLDNYEIVYGSYGKNDQYFEFKNLEFDIESHVAIIFCEVGYNNIVNINQDMDDAYRLVIAKGQLDGFHNANQKSKSKSTVDMIRVIGSNNCINNEFDIIENGVIWKLGSYLQNIEKAYFGGSTAFDTVNQVKQHDDDQDESMQEIESDQENSNSEQDEELDEEEHEDEEQDNDMESSEHEGEEDNEEEDEEDTILKQELIVLDNYYKQKGHIKPPLFENEITAIIRKSVENKSMFLTDCNLAYMLFIGKKVKELADKNLGKKLSKKIEDIYSDDPIYIVNDRSQIKIKYIAFFESYNENIFSDDI